MCYRTTFACLTSIEETVCVFEDEYRIAKHWAIGGEQFKEGQKKINNMKYLNALNKLEHLVVQRLLKLTKLNASSLSENTHISFIAISLCHLGYKLWNKITSALHSQGQAIQNALTAYNTAAAVIGRRSLLWIDVVNMATLADFDLLQDVKDSVVNKLWAKPEVWEAMMLYFCMKQAKEEIHCLNIEICQQTTYMYDEHTLYRSTANRIKEEQPHLAAYILQEGDHRDALTPLLGGLRCKARTLPTL
jgi:hypothetical protein